MSDLPEQPPQDDPESSENPATPENNMGAADDTPEKDNIEKQSPQGAERRAKPVFNRSPEDTQELFQRTRTRRYSRIPQGRTEDSVDDSDVEMDAVTLDAGTETESITESQVTAETTPEQKTTVLDRKIAASEKSSEDESDASTESETVTDAPDEVEETTANAEADNVDKDSVTETQPDATEAPDGSKAEEDPKSDSDDSTENVTDSSETDGDEADDAEAEKATVLETDAKDSKSSQVETTEPSKAPPDASAPVAEQSVPSSVVVSSTTEEPVADTDTEPSTEAPDTPAKPVQRYRYRVIMRPSEAIQEQVSTAAKEIGLDEDILQAYLQWHAEFQALDAQLVTSAITKWVHANLPIETSLKKVFSVVRGQRSYVAGWELNDTEKMQEAQRRLALNLGPFISIETTANTSFNTILPLAIDVPADRFPKLVAYLQQVFDEVEWSMTACELQQQAIDDDGRVVANSKWEVATVIEQEQS